MALQNQVGLFVGTTNVWDTSQIFQEELKDPAVERLFVYLYQNIGEMAIVLNLKDSGLYFPYEFINGQTFFPNPANSSATQLAPAERQTYRQLINFGALPNAGAKSVAHAITVTSVTTFTRIYATASDTSGNNYIPIPYIDPSGNNIALSVNGTTVTITTSSNRTNFNVCYVVLEYLQQ